MKNCFALFIVVAFQLTTIFPVRSQQLSLWYNKPASTWTEALPIGNGRLGAMIYGDAMREHIQFNEETLWSGGPRDYHREGAHQYLSQIRLLLEEGKQSEAEQLAEKHFMGKRINEEEYPEQREKWLEKIFADTAPSAEKYNDSRWKELSQPAAQGWESAGLDGVDGVVWLRNYFELPSAWKGKNLVLKLGRVRDMDVTYVNGKKVGTTEGRDDREYVIDAGLLRPGKNVIAIQVINFYDKGGLVGRNGNASPGIYVEGAEESSDGRFASTWRYWVQDENPPIFPRYQADYQPFGDVWLNFNHKNISAYKRELDIQQAISTVSYTADGVKFIREYFTSAPHQATVMHIRSDKSKSVSVTAALNTVHREWSTKKINDQTLKLSFKVRNGVLRGVSYLSVRAKNGTVTVTDNDIVVKGADEVTFFLTAGTSYKNYREVSVDPEELCSQPLSKIASLSYESIRTEHINDYQQYFNVLTLDLGSSSNEKLPTNERILNYSPQKDPSLITLYLQYARYLLLSSSRPGTRPANLQGIWNNLLTPPWGSKYTTNINVEMNYWPADLLNLSPCIEPLFQLIEDVSEAGRQTAKAHYNASGWVLHHNTDLWRGTAPINAANHGIWVTGGAWLCQHLWDHYLFTQDKKFLEERAYPVMKEAASFFVDFLMKDPETGWLISTPSNSPEQGGLVAGPTVDHQLIRSLFKNCIEASNILNTDVAFREKLEAMYPLIAPNQIGKHGQLQEWLEDEDDPKNKHRHVSHLWGVYPGTDITWDHSPDMMKAARQSLLFRGDGGTGWSLAWKVNLWARFKDGDHTLLMINKLLEPAAAGEREKGGVYFNLFDAHPPFQIDGNFGGAAGIAEMLVQSHMPYIDLLPALPSALPTGSIKGVCARGGFVLDILWKNEKLEEVAVTSRSGKDCTLRYGDREITFPTEKGKTYRLNGDLNNVR